MYIGGGFADGGVLVCEVRDLLQSATPQPLTPTHTHHCQVWRKIAELPVDRSSLVSLHGELLAIGGKPRYENEGISEVRQYDTATKSWKVISHMHTKRYQALAAVLPNKTVMIVGGYRQIYAHTGHVKITSVVQ